MMENAEVPLKLEPDDPNLSKEEIPSTHALGLRDLYNAAFSQEPETEFSDFHDKTTIITSNLEEEFYAGGKSKIERGLEKAELIVKNTNFEETYQLYTPKDFQYSVDFVKPEENSLVLNYEAPKESVEVLPNANILERPFEDTFQNDANSVLDLDKGVQIHLVKSKDEIVAPADVTYNFENCGYTGDAQILSRYLCDTALMKSDGTNISPDDSTVSAVGTVTLNFITKQNNNVSDRFDSESIGVNPEALGVRFEDCDFNSSDSFASTESIIPKNVKCPKCPKKFMFKADLLRHDKYKHSVKPKLICKYCNKEFASQQNLLFHEKSHKKKKNSYECDICKKSFKNSTILVKHKMKEHSKVTPFICGECGKIFPTRALANNHFGKVHLSESEKPFQCDICSKRFEKKQGLSCHAKAHIDDLPFVCKHCNKAFSKMCYLTNHLRSHSNEEKDSLVCDTCGKDFKSSVALEEHTRKHTGEKPYTCSVCLKSFAYKGYFKVHTKKHAEVKPFSCNSCQKTFATNSELTKHEKTHSKEKSFQCVNCNQEFPQQSQLTMHLKKQKCTLNKPQDVCMQTTEFVDGTLQNVTLQNVTLQNVNVIVDQTFTGQQPIFLTSLGSLINTNSVPVILTQNTPEPYSASSIT